LARPRVFVHYRVGRLGVRVCLLAQIWMEREFGWFKVGFGLCFGQSCIFRLYLMEARRLVVLGSLMEPFGDVWERC